MKIIACYANKGGVGKTAAAVNLAFAWAAAGKRVLLCDLDPQGAASFYFRVKPSKKLTEASFFEDVARFTKAIRASDFQNLDILPANMGFRDFDVLLAQMQSPKSRLKQALKAVQGDYDMIVLGGGAGGLVAAREAHRRGAKVVIVQNGPVGGDPTFTGCVP